MSVIIADVGITVPGSVVDLESFSLWVDSPEFPDTGRISFIRGDVIVEKCMEQLYTHNIIKLWIGTALAILIKSEKLGTYFIDGVRLYNEEADLSVEPDGLYFSYAAIRSGKVTRTEGAEDGYVRIDGSPELVVEVLSDSSEKKDLTELRETYFEAGIAEYWIADGREDIVHFEILRRGSKGFVSTRAQVGGWVKSAMLGKSFRLVRSTDPLGDPQFALESRD